VYRIGALCPYCMVVWVVTIVMFWYVTLHNLDRGHLPGLRSGAATLVKLHTVVPVAWLLVLAALIGEHFWYYWRTLL
jgi:hypothetical protein